MGEADQIPRIRNQGGARKWDGSRSDERKVNEENGGSYCRFREEKISRERTTLDTTQHSEIRSKD